MNYKNLLLEIQQSNNLGPSAGQLNFPEDGLYQVNLNTRTINGPSFLSVKDEHRAEMIYFEVDRFFGNMDLAQTNCIIQYTTNEGKSYYYPVPFCDVNSIENKMIIPWSISSAATASAGSIQYVIRFYLLNDKKIDRDKDGNILWDNLDFSYSLTTLPATSQILRSFALEPVLVEEDYHIETDQKFFELIQVLGGMIDNASVYWNEVIDL